MTEITVKEQSGRWCFAFSGASMATVHIERKEAGNLRVYLKPYTSAAGTLVHTDHKRLVAFACGVLPAEVVVYVESDAEITKAYVCSDDAVNVASI